MSLVEDKELVVCKEFVKSFNRADSSSKELFVQAFKLFKQNQGKEQQVKVNFTASLSKVSLGNEAIVQRGKRIVKLAEHYTTLKAVSNFSMLHFYNLESIVKVLLYVKDNELSLIEHKGVSYSMIRNRIASVYTQDVEKIDYNNAMKAELSDIKQKCNIVEQEGEIVSLDGKLKGMIMSLSDDDKLAVIEMLGGVMPEVERVA